MKAQKARANCRTGHTENASSKACRLFDNGQDLIIKDTALVEGEDSADAIKPVLTHAGDKRSHKSKPLKNSVGCFPESSETDKPRLVRATEALHLRTVTVHVQLENERQWLL
jgi:hypothetical protein